MFSSSALNVEAAKSNNFCCSLREKKPLNLATVVGQKFVLLRLHSLQKRSSYIETKNGASWLCAQKVLNDVKDEMLRYVSICVKRCFHEELQISIWIENIVVCKRFNDKMNIKIL